MDIPKLPTAIRILKQDGHDIIDILIQTVDASIEDMKVVGLEIFNEIKTKSPEMC